MSAVEETGEIVYAGEFFEQLFEYWIGWYAGGAKYRKVCLQLGAGASRFDLDGNEEGEICEEHVLKLLNGKF